MDAVLSLMPAEERVHYSAMTGQSLFYMGQTDLKHKILAIAEEEGAERASYALKLLQSEGELTIASTGKDPQTGKLVTHTYRVEGPVMIFLTTTAVEIDEELLNRCMVLTVDEAPSQTLAIHARQRASRTLDGLLARQQRAGIQALHQNAQRLLEPLFVTNPYAEHLRFSHGRTRTRRDHMKYLTLMESIALLYQHQRPKKTTEHGGKQVTYIEVTAADIAVANGLAQEVLGRSLDDLPPQTRRFLELLDGLVEQRSQADSQERRDVRFTRRQVRDHTHWSSTQVRVHLERLVELEYVVVHRGGPGQRFVYELVYRACDAVAPGLDDLVDVERLDSTGTTSTWRGKTPTWRGGSGGVAATLRGVENGSKPSEVERVDETWRLDREGTSGDEVTNPSYPQVVGVE
jgi:hypothetical protein